MDSGISHFNGRGCSSIRFRGNRGELFAEGKSWETLARPCALHVLHTAHYTYTAHWAGHTKYSGSWTVWPVYWIGRSLELNAHWGDIESARHVYPPSEILLQTRPLPPRPTIFDIRHVVVHCFPVYNAQTEAQFARSVMHLILTASHDLSWRVPTANLTDMSAVQTLREIWIYCNAKISFGEKYLDFPKQHRHSFLDFNLKSLVTCH